MNDELDFELISEIFETGKCPDCTCGYQAELCSNNNKAPIERLAEGFEVGLN